MEPFGVEEAPEENRLAEQGDHPVLFKRLPKCGAVWGAELVLVGPGHAAVDEVDQVAS